MTSYMYNPSQKVTEVLSKFLEFDPAQLELGIWSGDLSLRNVNLRQDAINPILNKKADKPHLDPKTKPPLRMKLVSGTVGNMRIRIPWKRLVWGQGAVQLEISDVMIVLALESLEETENSQGTNKKGKSKKKKNAASKEPEVSQSYRDAKQRRLREAERRHLQGMPVALWLELVHRKNSIEKDAAKMQEEIEKLKKVKEKEEGYLDRWMKNTTSDFFWRFYAGLQGSIKKARIVVVQDGVEVGCIIQSIEVLAGKEGAKMTVSLGEDESSADVTGNDDLSTPPNFVYESAYDDGEHVDKQLKQEGVGVFVRKEASLAKVPQALRFSSSVSADDYLLRPVNLNLNFSFFYPHPPERRGKKTTDSLSQDTNPTAASTAASTSGQSAKSTTAQSLGNAVPSGAVSVNDNSSTTSSKRRRGKREKVAPNEKIIAAENNRLLLDTAATLAVKGGDRNIDSSRRGTSSLGLGFKDRVQPLAGEPRHHRSHAHMRNISSSGSVTGPGPSRPRLRRNQSVRSMRSSARSADDASLAATELQSLAFTQAQTTQVPEKQMEIVPRVDCHLNFDDIRVVFSTRHYELLNHFLSTIARMKNGRPDTTITSVLDSEERALHRQRHYEQRVSPPNSPSPAPKSKTQKLKNALLAPLVMVGITSAAEPDPKLKQPNDFEFSEFGFQIDTTRPMRSQVTRKWWNYAIGAVLWELRKKKDITANFREMYLSFDWKRQRYKRQEYINLYISTRLESRPGEEVLWSFDNADDREKELLLIEDELPLEQILLYRSIARSLRGRGFKKMPASIHELNGLQPVIVNPRNRRGSLTSKVTRGSVPNQSRPSLPIGGGSTLLSMLQNKFEFAKLLRTKAGAPGKIHAGSHASFNAHMYGEGSSHGGHRHAGKDRRKASMGFDSASPSDSGMRTPRKASMGFDSTDGGAKFQRARRKGSMGHDSTTSDVQPGNFYTSGRSRDNSAVGDNRTVVTKQNRSVKRGGVAASAAETTTSVSDGSMKITFSVQIQSIDLMVLREEFYFDFSPDMKGNVGNNRFAQDDANSREYSSEEGSSSDDVSELSFLTDDQRFFNEQGQTNAVAEEEDDEGAKLSSTDFLRFGLPDNLILRMTLTPLSCSMRGRSGGTKHLTLSIGKITAVGEDDKPLLSVGPEQNQQVPTPVHEINLDLPAGKFINSRRQDEQILDNSTHRKSQFLNERESDASGHRRNKRFEDLLDTSIHRKGRRVMDMRSSQPRLAKAVSLAYKDVDGNKTAECDVMQLGVTIDLNSLSKLTQFYLKSEIRYPDKILPKSSREVARKFMVAKTAPSNSSLMKISTAIRFLGLEVRIPFATKHGDSEGSTSEASSLDSYNSSRAGGAGAPAPKRSLSVAVLAAETVELYSGTAVDDMCAAQATDFGTSKSSLWSGSLTSRKAPVKTLEMLDIAELTAAHDSFDSGHWVATLAGIDCVLDTKAPNAPKLTDIPLDVELLVTVNEQSLLETESPKHQLVVEVSPVQILFSANRLALLKKTISAVDFHVLEGAEQLKERRRRKPDPPRIETLSRRVLHSLDLSCKRVRVAVVDDHKETEPLTLKLKEVVMEECVSDFLSVVSCFDFSLPNEEALSSAMQICIGRLVGLGLSDDEAWGCTNAARLNLLDDIAIMRRAQNDALVQLSGSIRHHASVARTTLYEEDEESENDSEKESASASVDTSEDGESLDNSNESEESYESPEEESDEEDDDDSANSADIVDTTLSNAVEKTMAAFAPLLMEELFMGQLLTPIIVIDFPLGARLSTVKLFYDNHLTSFVPSVVVTNSAGIELLTLVPSSTESVGSNQERPPGHGLLFSRFDVDKGHSFGSGGLPMSALASDSSVVDDFRERGRLDDIELGEIEILFSSSIYEEIIDELSKLGGKKKEEDDESSVSDDSVESRTPAPKPAGVESSSVLTAFCVSMLMTSDELVPFSRLTLEGITYKNKTALAAASRNIATEVPSWLFLADSISLQHLTPEGQFYPDAVALLCQNEASDKPFQIRYYKSADPWKIHNRLDIQFRGFRIYLIRQFLHELLNYLVYDRYGVGRLKKKYSKDIRDANGNQKPPLLYTVTILDSSVICPRKSSCSDMVAFEVERAFIGVSYHPESFAMPTESSHFQKDPSSEDFPGPESDPPRPKSVAERRNSMFSVSDYHDCVDGSSKEGSSESRPISSFNSAWRRRLTIKFERMRAFTAISSDEHTKDVIESPLFRFFHELDGRAEPGKSVYVRRPNVERQPSVSPEALRKAQKHEQYWEEMSTNYLNLEVLADNAPHLRLLIADREGLTPFSLNAKLSQFCLLVSVWDSNMQEMPGLFTFGTPQVQESASPPIIPKDFPAYGSEEFATHLENLPVPIKSEIGVMFKNLTLRCTYDPPGHFAVDPDCFQYMADPRCPEDQRTGIVVSFSDAVIHVVGDHLNIKRIGIGASNLSIVDERQHAPFQQILTVRPTHDSGSDPEIRPPAWADLKFGLREDVRTLSDSLPQPFQMSVFMCPGWSMINVGAQCADGVMFDMSWIWVFLDFFTKYYKDIAFGNPGHQAQRWAHKMKNALRRASGLEAVKFEPLPGVNVDFRMWLCRPILCVPSDYHDPHAPCLRLESSRSGLYYRFKNLPDFSSQEVVSTDIDMYFANEFQSPHTWRRNDVRDSISGKRPLVEGLSFGLRYDCNNAFNHKDVTVKIPFVGDDVPSCAHTGKELAVQPIILPSPTVCTPVQLPRRGLGPTVCEITCIIEVLPITSATLLNFFKGPAEVNEEFVPHEEDQGPPTFSVAASVEDLRVFAIDPVLGVQLPVAVISISSIQLTASKFAIEPSSQPLHPGESPPEDLQVTMDSSIWADYFKLGITRSWEPLLEPYKCLVVYEKSKERGQGMSLESDSPFHLNLSSALLQVLGETIESFSRSIGETFGDQASSGGGARASLPKPSPSKDRVGAIVEDSINTMNGLQVTVLHEIPKPLKSDDRVAFSLRNLTGQKIRIHQQTDVSSGSATQKPPIVTYLNQVESMGLTFNATISVIKNLSIVEVPYPGLPNSRNGNRNQGSLNHAVDVQVPGFRWLQGIKVDTFGRKFEALAPRSIDVGEKVFRDWRLKNAMMLLTEVGLDSGGRLVTVRSLFEVRNNTTHPIKIVFNPDPTHRPNTGNLHGTGLFSAHEREDETIGDQSSIQHSIQHTAHVDEAEFVEPGESFQLSTLLLERALQMTGSHLGCVWICPDIRDVNSSFLRSFHSGPDENRKDLHVGFSSRPIQLAKVVHESSLIFQNGGGEDVPVDKAKSGVQVSCPTRGGNQDGQAPFCYAIEVGRSPIVNTINDKGPSEPTKESSPGNPVVDKKGNPLGAEKKAKKTEKIHGPVAYTLSIHAPLVVVNLLPEGGRFELMHAIRRTVLWYADLQPGQQIPVHSVGLDAPLLLLVNLGFCRTPVGEGALVHHGSDAPQGLKEQVTTIKSIGKVVTKGTKQIGKTLTAMSDSPDKHRRGLLNKMQNPQFQRDGRKEKLKHTKFVSAGATGMGLDTGVGGIDTVDGKIHSVETVAYSAADVATETTVVDGVGQRLSLSIENVRGGGGQRRISLFCPFWIVNTTEHSLRYKQEKGKAFVSGTVTSSSHDGSRPVDGSNRNYRNRHRMRSSRRGTMDEHNFPSKVPLNGETIFSGTPGALATAHGRCDLPPPDLSKLLETDMPLETLANLAFMFNFHEDVLSIGHQALCVQLYDGTGVSNYVSDWSRGFSLDSVGFSQIVGMHCKEGRTLELSVTVNVAPGFLSGYTKIVRFLPRYVVYNRLKHPIRLWQDSSVFRPAGEDRATVNPDGTEPSKESRKWRYSHEEKHHRDKINQYEALYGRPATLEERKVAGIPEGTTAHRSACYIASIGPSELIPFHLPDSRGERQLRVDLGGPWNITASVASDYPGEHTLKVSEAMDLRLLNHVSTRAAPKYKILLPPPDETGIGQWDGELGVYFETDWGGDRKIIVKGTKRGKYAFNHTDIHVGDELLRIDGISVFKMSFVETMKLLKERLNHVSSSYSQQLQQKAEDQPKKGLRRLSITQVIRRPGYSKHAGGSEDLAPKPTHLTLTFRTLEERLRKLRVKAGREGNGPASKFARHASQRQIQNTDERSPGGSMEAATTSNVGDISVEMKSLHNTMYVVLRPQDKNNPPFCIQNRSINYAIFYRQRGCDGHSWNHLRPGESKPYAWEEPMKSKKLTVRVAAHSQEFARNDASSHLDSVSDSGTNITDSDTNATNADLEKRSIRTAKLKQAFSYQFVDSEERGEYGASVTVRLEEIGFKNFLPLPAKDAPRNSQDRRKFLNCEVDTDGGTRLLIISDDAEKEDDRGVLNQHVQTLKKQIIHEQTRLGNLQILRNVLDQPLDDMPREESSNRDPDTIGAKIDSSKEREVAVENDAKRLVEDFSEDSTITHTHQVVVEVLEAVGLNPTDLIGGCNPYCELSLKGRSKSRKHLFQKKSKQKTYFVEKSLRPKWTDQIFVFNVPRAAVKVTRGHSIEVKVRNFRYIGQHPILGQASVHFGSVRDQRELEGWYPLAGRTGRRDIESASASEFGRGSVKLRVQWVYTIPALLDYFLLLSERRLTELSNSHTGMTNQLSHATESDQRKRDAKDNSGRIQKLAKLQRKKKKRATKPPSSRAINASTRQLGNNQDNVVGKINQGLNGGIGVLKQALKTSRDKYLYALYFQTVESKRNRQGEQEELEGLTGTSNEPMNMNRALPMIKEQKSPMPVPNERKKSLESFFSTQRSPGVAKRQSPEKFQSTVKSLDDFFSQQKEQGIDPGLPLTKNELPVQAPRIPKRGSGFFGDSKSRVTSHRRLSLDLDEPQAPEQEGDQWEPSLRQGQAAYESMLRESHEIEISDLISVNTDADAEVKRKKHVKRLLELGFVFHESGEYFHVDHLPNQFRRTLFAGSMAESACARLYRPRWYTGSPSCIRHFKSWQAAQNIFWDPELEVIKNKADFTIRLRDKMPSTHKEEVLVPVSRALISERITVPDVAPKVAIERARSYVASMVLSRNKFERACKRTLSTVLNPGGWLTIRPITALNLPDNYTGMYVKLRYGSEVKSSETVDAKVAPRWTPADFFDDPANARSVPVATSPEGGSVSGFNVDANDLVVPVEPQQTSGVIKISVFAERLNTKVELGVLNIPLGAAIAACIDSAEDVRDGNASTSDPPIYIRWFPLMSPRVTVPVEGDMGLSNRPQESEKLRDNMFKQYFAPCIQLALIWSPDRIPNIEIESEEDDDDEDEVLSGALTFSDPTVSLQPTETSLIEKYFNADIGRISAALIDSQRAVELLSFSALDIDVRYSVTKAKTRIGLVVGWIQLDNQEGRAREPVVLAPTPVLHRQPTLQILAVKDNLRSKSNIVSYEYIGVALQEMDLTVEESWIFELWDFLMGIMKRRAARKRTVKGQRRADVLLTSENCFAASDSEDTESDPTLLSLLEGGAEGEPRSSRRKMYVEQLILGIVKVNLSYIKGKKQSWELTENSARKMKNLEVKELPNLAITPGAVTAGNNEKKDQSETFVRWSQHTYDEDMLAENGGTMTYNLPALIAAVFPSVSDAPIRLQGKVIDHVFESPGEILSSITNFYKTETLKQVYKIIGSLDIVGNPTVILSSFVSGVKDLVVAPTTAFLKSPTNVNKVGIGVAKGTISLFSHSASGIFGFVAKASATAGQAAAILSLDTEYRQWHRDRVVSEATNLNRVWKRRGVQSISEMVTRPVGDILMGVAMGASGVFLSPYKGLRRGGTLGLVQGVAVGTVGIVAKPIVGFLDALTHFTATAHDIAKSVNVLERRFQPALKLRLPYTFGPMNILSPFNPVTARAVYLLKVFPSKTRRNSQRRGDVARWKEIHVASVVLHMEPGVETFAIATTVRVVLIKLKKENSGSLLPSFCWEVDLTGRGVVSSRVSDHGHNGVALTITMRAQENKKNSGAFSKEMKPIPPIQALSLPNEGGNVSSARSVGSFVSVSEDTGIDEFLGAENSRQDLRPVLIEPQPEVEAQPGTDTAYNHGATKKGGEVLEWFTVLSEYQHRRQLTSLHNAISNIVGDFDAVVVEAGLGQETLTEGVTSFGMFEFESCLPDGKASQASNAELVVALESLPWMHENVFKEYQGKSRSQQREAVCKIRQNWVFSRDLEASMAEGGPAWLVEARARAMFVSMDAPILPDFLDPEDPVVKEVLAQLEEGNISSEQATELLYSHDEMPNSDYEDDTSLQHELSSDDEGGVSLPSQQRRYPSTEEQKLAPPGIIHNDSENDVPEPALGGQFTPSQNGKAPNRRNDPVETYRSLENRNSGNSVSHHTLERQGSLGTPLGMDEVTSLAPSATHASVDFVDIKSVDGMSEKRSMPPIFVQRGDVPFDDLDGHGVQTPSNNLSRDMSAGEPKTPSTISEHRRPYHSEHHRSYDAGTISLPHSESRMERMETLMEQLVILNASQAHREATTAPTEILSDTNSVSSTTRAADSLRYELADLKAQVMARTKEDEALRDEISALREQLAERRATPIKTPGKASRDTSHTPKLKFWGGGRKLDTELKVGGEGENNDGAKPDGRILKTSRQDSTGDGSETTAGNKGVETTVVIDDQRAASPGRSGRRQRRMSAGSTGTGQRMRRRGSGDSEQRFAGGRGYAGDRSTG